MLLLDYLDDGISLRTIPEDFCCMLVVEYKPYHTSQVQVANPSNHSPAEGSFQWGYVVPALAVGERHVECKDRRNSETNYYEDVTDRD